MPEERRARLYKQQSRRPMSETGGFAFPLFEFSSFVALDF
jgi:hypothetical protein